MSAWLLAVLPVVILTAYTVAYFRHDPVTCPVCKARRQQTTEAARSRGTEREGQDNE